MPLDLINEYNPMDLHAPAKPLMKTDIASRSTKGIGNSARWRGPKAFAGNSRTVQLFSREFTVKHCLFTSRHFKERLTIRAAWEGYGYLSSYAAAVVWRVARRTIMKSSNVALA